MHAYMCQNIKLAGILKTDCPGMVLAETILNYATLGKLVKLSLLLLTPLQNGDNYYNKFTGK